MEWFLISALNAKTARLLRKVSLQEGKPLKAAKKFWSKTPWNKRAQLRADLQSVLVLPFHVELQRWQKAKKLLQKEAAGILEVPFDTYRNWIYCKNEPSELAIKEIKRRMEDAKG